MRGQQRNVLAAIAQRRQMDLDRVQAEQQILAEAARGHLLVQVGVGRRDHAHVHLAASCDEPTRSNSPVSSTRSSLACRFSGTLAISSRNSVPPSASSKRPTRSALGVGERALHVAEQFALEDALRESAGVHRDQRRAARSETACSVCATTSLPVRSRR